jgi:hypothetical protein
MSAVSLIESISTFLRCESTCSSLQTRHRHLAVSAGDACRYPADIVPFAAIIPSDPTVEIIRLCGANTPKMVALTNLAFPGLFRIRTHEMGSYYGVRSEGQLNATGGERLALDGYSEISGVCTHPARRGKALAANVIWQLVRDHLREGLVSWLHVSSENRRASTSTSGWGSRWSAESPSIKSLATFRGRLLWCLRWKSPSRC